MANKRRLRLPTQEISVASQQINSPRVTSCRKPFFGGILTATIVVLIGVTIFYSFKQTTDKPRVRVATYSGPTLGSLSMMSARELQAQDIAVLNLQCASGLPGTEDLNVAECLQTLDNWAAQVRN